MRVFEALLRLGGNLVIPGTDLPRNGVQAEVAAEMGLYLTHHHAEPLGSEMFFRAYPNSDASFDRNPELFAGLWREAIERHRDHAVVWTLGFRGQGDRPFWEDDPIYDTDERRGELISRAIRFQYDMLREAIPGAACITYLYGEVAELYRDGHIVLPDDVTRIWSDNGYGRMVTRRQGNHNLRIPALPAPEATGLHGIYYHAAFHDLQASSHLAMLPVSTELIVAEVEKAFAARADEVVLVNCGNVRPHVFTLDLLARLWRDGSANPGTAAFDFAKRYFSNAQEDVARGLKGLIEAAASYGPNEDDRAGDEFYHHPTRVLIGRVMRGETASPANELNWAAGDRAFDEQVRWFQSLSSAASKRYSTLLDDYATMRDRLPASEVVLFDDLLVFQARFMQTGAEGLDFVARSILAHLAGEHPKAFVLISQALWAFERSQYAMHASEHGKWENFFRADWLTNVKMTIYCCQSLRMFYRMHGDNPDFFLWHKEYLMPESEKKIYLENTHRNPPEDDDLAQRLKVRFGM